MAEAVPALIRDLLASGRAATDDEIAAIVRRIAEAPFNQAIVRVPTRDRNTRYAGNTLGARADSADYHLVKRVAIEQQWAPGTTFDQYLADLRAAVLDPTTQLAIYSDRGLIVATTLGTTNSAVPPSRRGPRTRPLLAVVNAPDRDTVLTGYQCSGVDTLRIPGDARWLR